MRHLWEVEHDYYCEPENYYTKPGTSTANYKSWADFLVEFEDAEMHYNLLFRWDWNRNDESYPPDPNYDATIDDNYRGYTLEVAWMGQRKGLYFHSSVQVCRADEAAVIEYLTPRLEYLKKLWEPLT